MGSSQLRRLGPSTRFSRSDYGFVSIVSAGSCLVVLVCAPDSEGIPAWGELPLRVNKL
jgi:hypothetical protein